MAAEDVPKKGVRPDYVDEFVLDADDVHAGPHGKGILHLLVCGPEPAQNVGNR